MIVALQSLRELTSAQLDAFKIFDLNQFMRLDMELENAVGDKERKIGRSPLAPKSMTKANLQAVNDRAGLSRGGVV